MQSYYSGPPKPIASDLAIRAILSACPSRIRFPHVYPNPIMAKQPKRDVGDTSLAPFKGRGSKPPSGPQDLLQCKH